MLASFIPSLFMGSLVGVWDEAGWVTDRALLDQYATFLAVRRFDVIHGLAFELSSLEAHISWIHEAMGAEKDCFHLASLASGLRFPLPRFIVELLNEYGIAPS